MPRSLPLLATLLACTLLCACQQSPRSASIDAEPAVVFTSKSQTFKAPLAGAIEEFRRVVEFDGGDQEQAYRDADAALTRGRAAAGQALMQIDRIDQAAQNLFAAWQSELGGYADPARQAESAQQLAAARDQHERSVTQMREAHRAIEPVLTAMHDLTLALRHRLYARALGEVAERDDRIRENIAEQIARVQRAIDEAEAKLDSLDR